MARINASIVLYNTPPAQLSGVVNAFLSTPVDVKLFLIDNSPTDALREIIKHPRIEYIFNNKNMGYGSAHNIGMKKSMEGNIDYHLVINPDVYFGPDVLPRLLMFMDENPDIGLLMPKVYFEDGTLQRLCKLLPTPFDLFARRFFPNTSWAIERNKQYELHDFSYNSILDTPCLSGCFMLIRTTILNQSGIFDPRYFMYLEDYDLVRRINLNARTIYYPGAFIFHGHQKESYKSKKLLKIHLLSAIKYFNKWGWIFDKVRKTKNKEIIEKIKYLR